MIILLIVLLTITAFLLVMRFIQPELIYGLRRGLVMVSTNKAFIDKMEGRPDVEVFSAAQAEGRAVVTENVRDFRPLARAWEADGKIHYGLVLTSNRKFPRARAATIGRIVTTLAKIAAQTAADEPSNEEIWL